LYSDLRASAETEQIRAALAADGQDWDGLTGNLQDASSCAAMFRRLARTEPGATAAARGITFGPAGHLAHALGTGLRCDLTTAAATGLLDARTRDWSPDVAHAAGIDLALLPRLTSHLGEIVGRTDGAARDLTGLPPGVPIALAGGAELHISALLAAGAAAAWARSAYLAGADAESADRLLEQRMCEHGRGPTGLLVLPSLGGERFPVRDENLRGAVPGLDSET